MRQQLIEKYPELKGQKIEYTLDSTSISSHSRTNALVNMAKQNAHLKQINETFVCNQRTGELLFVHVYDGSLNDVLSLKDVLMEMTEAGFDLSNNTLVTDRGYSSLINVQKMLNLNLDFIQGVRRQSVKCLTKIKNGY